MSYKIEPIHISFKNNFKGKIAALSLHEVDQKINTLLQTNPCDILSTRFENPKLRGLLSERNRCFSMILEQVDEQIKKDNFARSCRLVASVAFVVLGYRTICDTWGYPELKPSGACIALVLGMTLGAIRVINNNMGGLFKTSLIQRYLNSVKIEVLAKQDCRICLESISEGAIASGHLASGKIEHLFHTRCLEPMTRLKGCFPVHDCPLCREEIVSVEFKL